MADAATPLRVRGAPDLVAELATVFEESPHAELKRVESQEDAGAGVNFALEPIVSIIGLVSTLFFDGPIIPTLVRALRKRPGTTVTIETPMRTVSITASAELTGDEVRELLRVLTP